MSTFEYWMKMIKYGGLLILLICVGTLIASAIHPLLGFFVFVGTTGYCIYSYIDSNKSTEFIKERISKITWRHRETLARKRRRTVRSDDYGTQDFGKWISEIDYFLDRVIQPDIPDDKITAFVSYPRPAKIQIIDDIVRAVELPQRDFDHDFSAEDFEDYVAEKLSEKGWSTRLVGKTGDQGADVMASKNGVDVVIQCKKYSKPVGNFAVQEAHAAKAHYSADVAVVISNAEFTASAKELAVSTDVVLMDVIDIDYFDDRIFGR